MTVDSQAGGSGMSGNGMPDEVRQKAREAADSIKRRYPAQVEHGPMVDAAAEVAYAAGVADERARVVADLRTQAQRRRESSDPDAWEGSEVREVLADLFERGGHLAD